ncbi:MAG: lamin tail domain-containing protein, partial [Planctomycetales bacterium]|nr:lamin tail domain-containing protein [Planctomycetales bacterium]
MPVRFGLNLRSSRTRQSRRQPQRNRLSRRAGSQRLGYTFEVLEERQVLDSTVVFNEVMYNPAGAVDDQMEWIELYNQLTVDMDLSDWELRGAVEYKFPDHTIVPGKGYLLVAANPTRFQTDHPGLTALGPWTGQLGNGGDTLMLYNNDDRQLNVVDFKDDGDWPSGPDGTGLTLAKRSPIQNSEDAENWTFSEQMGGTPGKLNFITEDTKELTPLLTSPNPATAIVPSDGSLSTNWTVVGFDDSAWLQGTGGVGYDTQTGYNAYLGIDLDEPPNGQTPQPSRNVNTSVYMRFPFELTGNTFDYESLSLRMRYDDGFVAYLNGVEVASRNAPGRDGNTTALTWNSSATTTNSDAKAIAFEDVDLGDVNSLLRQGTNVLAIHGLNRTISDSDLLFDAELVGIKTLDTRDQVPLRINEVAGANDGNFFVEIINAGDAPVDLTGFGLLAPDSQIARYALPSQSLAPGAMLVVTQQQLGATAPESGDHFLIQGPRGYVTDAIRVTNKLQGRAPSRDDAWMFPSQATPGSANVFALHDDIVINEIMYNPSPKLAVADVPPQYTSSNVVSMTSNAWLYNDTGSDYPGNWAAQTYAIDNQTWKAGQGLIAYESSTLAYPKNTILAQPSTNDPRFYTYYFQTTFDVSAEQLASVDRIALRHMIDDGAIFYINGIEIERFNLPSSGVTSATAASASVANATLVGPIASPASVLRVGSNTLSVEVHMRTLSDSDIVFGAQLDLETQVTDLVPGSPYRERDEMEYIELFNRSDAAIDVSGWEINDAIDYKIPDGTQIAAHQYLVIAKDTIAFHEIYPGVPAIGDFSGSLSNHDERIRLLDARGNLADSVHYFEGGRWPATADAGGSSLELIDPYSDNNRGESWAASDDSAKSEWTTVTHKATSLTDVFNQRARFDEFLFGILDAGEFLIDDVSVLKHTGDTSIEVIQNGSFEADALGSEPAKWRIIGNHSGTVEVDPTDPSNKVLHVVATGAQANVHDHAETTFANSEDLSDGLEYTLSFRVKWITGNSQI